MEECSIDTVPDHFGVAADRHARDICEIRSSRNFRVLKMHRVLKRAEQRALANATRTAETVRREIEILSTVSLLLQMVAPAIRYVFPGRDYDSTASLSWSECEALAVRLKQ